VVCGACLTWLPAVARRGVVAGGDEGGGLVRLLPPPRRRKREEAAADCMGKQFDGPRIVPGTKRPVYISPSSQQPKTEESEKSSPISSMSGRSATRSGPRASSPEETCLSNDKNARHSTVLVRRGDTRRADMSCVPDGPFGMFPNCDNLGGALFLNAVYGYALLQSAKSISDGKLFRDTDIARHVLDSREEGSNCVSVNVAPPHGLAARAGDVSTPLGPARYSSPLQRWSLYSRRGSKCVTYSIVSFPLPGSAPGQRIAAGGAEPGPGRRTAAAYSWRGAGRRGDHRVGAGREQGRAWQKLLKMSFNFTLVSCWHHLTWRATSGRPKSKEEAQAQVAVGMGTLAGSTVMLLTIAWAGSLWVGSKPELQCVPLPYPTSNNPQILLAQIMLAAS